MKFCPQCKLEYEDETVFCSNDGSRLQVRAPRNASGQPVAAGAGVAVLSSQPLSALGATALQVPTPPRGMNAPVRTGRTPAAAVHAMPESDTVRPPRSGARAASEGLSFDNDDVSELTMRQPLVSVELQSPSSPDFDGLEAPTVAMRAPSQRDTDEGGPSLVGTLVAGRYRVARRLGEGGMGVVYEAIDDRLEKPVAVKVLREDFARRQDVVARFTQEAKSAARIKHENVLDVTDYGQTEEGSFYIAMELLVGTDLADVLQSEGVLSPERGIDVAMQVCRALQAAHNKNIVHRDLKPENVFLVRTDDGHDHVKIVDFGIAQMKDISGSVEGSRKLTRTGMIFGTPEYMSPEQAAGKPIDHRVDIYAVGVILYEMFAGRVPFVGDTFMGILTQHMFEPLPPIRAVNPNAIVSPELEAVIAKSLAKDPAQRYASMQELHDDLARVRSGARPQAALVPPMAPVAELPRRVEGLPVGPSPTLEGATPRPRYQRAVAIAVGGLVLVVAVVLAFWLGRAETARPHLRSEAPVARPPAAEPPVVQPPVVQPPVVQSPVVQSPVVQPPVVQPPAAERVALRVRVVGFNARTITFAYENAPSAAAIAPCTDDPECTRPVLAGQAIRVTASNTRQRGSAIVTPTRDGEEVRITASRVIATHPPSSSARPSNNTVRDPQPSGSQTPCGSVDPRTGLMRICL